MRFIGTFTPQANPTGTFNLTVTQGKVLFSNESCSNLQVVLSDQSSFKLPAGVQRLICINQQNSNISYSTLSQLNIPCIDAVDVEVYDPGESIVESYPSAMVRQAIVGNSLNLNTSVTNLVNDGNTQQVIIEATPSGAASSTVSIDNEGNTTIKGNNAGVLTTLLQLVAGASPAVKIAAASIVAEVLGDLQVDGTLDVNSITAPLDSATVLSVSAGKTRLQSSALVALQVPAGTDRVSVNTTDFSLLNGLRIAFTAGHLGRKGGNTSAAGSGTTISHGVGTTPEAVIATPNIAQPGSATIGVGNIGATTFQVTVGSGSSVCWFAESPNG